MRTCVTGGAGFIGSHLVDALLARGDSVTVLDDLSTGSIGNIAGHLGNERFEFVQGSILDAPTVSQAIRGCETVFHLAAAVGVRLIVERPMHSFRTNVEGTEVVLAETLRTGARVLVTSTSEIYGKSAAVPLREDDDRLLGSALVARWSYSMAKAVDELLAYQYWVEDALEAVIVRLFNTTGPRQSPGYGMVLPRFVRQALADEPLTVHGDGTQRRCFGYVGDIVPAMMALTECDDAVGQAINLGSTEETSIAELASLVIELTGSVSPVRFVPYDEAFPPGFEDLPRRVPSIEKAQRLIGFAPSASLREIVQLTIADARQEAMSAGRAG
ncbi:MAG: NAD-dependent epimerase/dehydratase family protein [Acidimicrobiia bacterium]